MKRGLIILSIVLAFGISAKGQKLTYDKSRWTYGIEWNYSATFFHGYHYYFIAPEGHREFPQDDKFCYFTNEDALLHIGYNLNEKWNLSLYTGYTSLGDYHSAIPVSFRATRSFDTGMNGDKWLVYGDLGTGISIKKHPREILSGKIGGGYRLSLSSTTKLDFLASIRAFYTHNNITYYGEVIDKQHINRDDAYVVSLSLGIGITF